MAKSTGHTDIMEDSCENNKSLSANVQIDWLKCIFISSLLTAAFACSLVPLNLAPQLQGELQDTSIMEHKWKRSHNHFCLLHMFIQIFAFNDSSLKRPRLHFRCDSLSVQFKSKCLVP